MIFVYWNYNSQFTEEETKNKREKKKPKVHLCCKQFATKIEENHCSRAGGGVSRAEKSIENLITNRKKKSNYNQRVKTAK